VNQEGDEEAGDRIDLAVEPVLQQPVEEHKADIVRSGDDSIESSEPDAGDDHHISTMNHETSETIEVTVKIPTEKQSGDNKDKEGGKLNTKLESEELMNSHVVDGSNDPTIEGATSSESATKKGASKRKIRPPRQSNVTNQPPNKKAGKQRKGKKKTVSKGLKNTN